MFRMLCQLEIIRIFLNKATLIFFLMHSTFSIKQENIYRACYFLWSHCLLGRHMPNGRVCCNLFIYRRKISYERYSGAGSRCSKPTAEDGDVELLVTYHGVHLCASEYYNIISIGLDNRW